MGHQHNPNSLYEFAVKQATLPQPVVVRNELLLAAPNSIIFEVFGTIVREPSAAQQAAFIESHLVSYLSAHWQDKTVKRAVQRLRRGQALDFRAGSRSAPAVAASASASSSTTARKPQAAKTKTTPTKPPTAADVAAHVLWRVQNGRPTQISSLIVKLSLDDGYRSGELKAEAYDDVAAAFSDWRGAKLVKLYAFGNAPAEDQRLVCSSTTVGNLSPWIANYVDGSDKKRDASLLMKLSSALRDKTKNCIYLTHDLDDAFAAVDSKAVRCSLVLLRNSDNNQQLPALDEKRVTLVRSAKVYFVPSLRAINFAPDADGGGCC